MASSRLRSSALLLKDDEFGRRYRTRNLKTNHTPPISPIIRRNSLARSLSHSPAFEGFEVWQDDEPNAQLQRATPSHIAPQHQHWGTVAPLAEKTNMPPQEKSTLQNGKPLVPTLASKRNVKSPITPRLATTTPPVARTSVPRIGTPVNGSVKSPLLKEELATPAKALIGSNVTPRSGSRKSRLESPSTTPSGTPTTSRPMSHVDGVGSGGKSTQFQGFGLGIVGQANRSRPSSMVGGLSGTASPGITSQSKFFSNPDDGQFFHANDGPQQRSPDLRPAVKKPPSFFYANGDQDESTRPTSQPSPPLSSVSTKSKKPQFFHADGRADEDIPPVPSLPLPLPSPTALNNAPQFFQAAPAFRPPSPCKEPSNFHLSYRKGASQIIRPREAASERPKTISILPTSDGVEARKRSVGAASVAQAPHKRTSSLSSIESGSTHRKPSGAGLEATGLTPLKAVMQAQSPVPSETSSAPPLARSPSPISEHDLALATSSSTSHLGERKVSPSSPILSFPQSPTKSQGSLQAQLAETIMNARVERKIQDLEISNSSLMAINKSLEKEVRRQNRELRRFRRLSRAGRLSTASTMLSAGTNDDHELGELSALDELTEEEEEEEEEEPEELSSSSSDDDIVDLSPEAMEEREARKLAKDSKRLQLDLAKHRDILVDSQKLNQSLKRCMAWTELMLKDGKKALEYKAEHELPGRVLDHADEERQDEASDDEDGPRHSLLSSWTPSPGPMQHLEALDGLLGLDTSAITNGTTTAAMPHALEKGDFWSIAGALE